MLALGAPAAFASQGHAQYDPTVVVPDGAVDPTVPPAPVPLRLAYAADLGQNRLGVEVVTGGAQFTDALAPPGPVAGCDAVCSLTNVESVSVDLGDDDDTIAVGAGLPPTTVDGGAGTDRADYSASSTPQTIALDATAPGGLTLGGVEDATGGAVDDHITGGAGANSLAGLAGADTIDGAAGADYVSGGADGDTLDGGTGPDTVRGGAGDDTIAGGDADDTLLGDSGADTIDAGLGDDDVLAADGAQDTILCGDGEDSVAADLGAAGVTDVVDVSCETVTGAVALPDPAPADPAPSAPVKTSAPATLPAVITRLPVPVIVDVPAAPGDLTPPSASLRAAFRQRLATVLVRGVQVPVACGEACGVSVTVLLDRAAAKKLGLAGRAGPSVIGVASAKLAGAGSRALHVRLTPAARHALRRSKGVTITVQMLASDASGNGTLLQRRVVLRR